jgi:hypothetical protein
MVTVHVSGWPSGGVHPVQSLDVPAGGEASSVTTVPCGYRQPAVQSSPTSSDPVVAVTPWDVVSVNSTACSRSKVAVTSRGPLSVTVQSSVPEQPPPRQPAKSDPSSAACVRITWLSRGNAPTQSFPQAMPAGLLVTVPLPSPAGVTVNETSPGRAGLKRAVILMGPSTVKAHGSVPLQSPPLQPANVESPSGVGTSRTREPRSTLVRHEPGQSMPAALVTSPAPRPASRRSGGQAQRV